MKAANGNAPLSETEGLVENLIDDLLAEAELEGLDGPIDPREALTEMAARAQARVVLAQGVLPDDAEAFVRARAIAIMVEAVEQASARLAPNLRLVKAED